MNRRIKILCRTAKEKIWRFNKENTRSKIISQRY